VESLDIGAVAVPAALIGLFMLVTALALDFREQLTNSRKTINNNRSC
jgi:hypothetical protein